MFLFFLFSTLFFLVFGLSASFQGRWNTAIFILASLQCQWRVFRVGRLHHRPVLKWVNVHGANFISINWYCRTNTCLSDWDWNYFMQPFLRLQCLVWLSCLHFEIVDTKFVAIVCYMPTRWNTDAAVENFFLIKSIHCWSCLSIVGVAYPYCRTHQSSVLIWGTFQCIHWCAKNWCWFDIDRSRWKWFINFLSIFYQLFFNCLSTVHQLFILNFLSTVYQFFSNLEKNDHFWHLWDIVCIAARSYYVLGGPESQHTLSWCPGVSSHALLDEMLLVN